MEKKKSKDTEIYLMEWNHPYSTPITEQIVIDEVDSIFSERILEIASNSINRIEYDMPLEYAGDIAKTFSQKVAYIIPYLDFKDSSEYHKSTLAEKTLKIWPKYIENFKDGPKRLSTLEKSNLLNCIGQSLIVKQNLNGWELYNKYRNKRLPHGLLAKELSNGYICIDVCMSLFDFTKHFLDKPTFNKKTIPADIRSINEIGCKN